MWFQEAGVYVTYLVTDFLSRKSEDLTVDSTESQSTAVAKALCVLALFVSAGICGYTPFILARWFDWKNSDPNSTTGIWIRCLLYFGGGCLICVTYQHIVVEVGEDIEKLQANGRLPRTVFNLALFLMCIGFMTMFLIEELIHLYMSHHERKTAAKRHQAALESDHSNTINYKESQSDNLTDYQTQHNHHHNGAVVHTHLPPTDEDDSESIFMSSLRGLLVVLALSIHALFEGLAIGLEETAQSAWYTTGAISGHKLVLAFCIGIQLIVAKTRFWLAIVYVFIFISVAPIGIGIGILITSKQNPESEVPAAIIQGLTSGTLMYVAFFEILFKERSGLWTWIGFVLGFFVMWGIIVITHE